MEFAGPALPLTDEDIGAAAASLGLEPAVIAAVAEVESNGHGFLPDGRPKILFERHIFSRETGHRFDRTNPEVSGQATGGYGAGGEHQYERLHEAIPLNRTAALRSASWGRFQVMGFNHEIVGFADVEAFVAAMMQSELAHLAAMLAFCKHNKLIDDLAAHDWRGFAAGYNGAGNVDRYSTLLAQAYAEQAAIWANKHIEGAAPSGDGEIVEDDDDREFARSLAQIIQQVLVAAGEDIEVDGILGPASRAAFDSLASRTR